jgi:hypothetical protein
VQQVVMATLAGKRAYPLLLTEAEALRAQAEKAGPGGLRALFSEPEVKAKWQVEVTTADLGVLEELAAPQPADSATIRPEPHIASSLAVAGNPVALAEAESRYNAEPDAEPEIRLVQATGFTKADPPTAEERGQLVTQLRGYIASRMAAAANTALGRKL